MKPVLFNAERSKYYKAKKRDFTRANEERKVLEEDATFIHYYGMSAFLELVPEAKDFGIGWHRDIIKELEFIRKKELAQQLSGIYMANAATKDKKANRGFRQIISKLTKWG